MLKPLRTLARWLSAAELGVIVVGVTLSVASARALPWVASAAATFWLVRFLAYGQLHTHTPADWPIRLLVLLLPVTWWATAQPATTAPQVYRLLTGVALYYALINWTTGRARLQVLVLGMTLAGLLLAGAAAFVVVWPTGGGKLPFIPATLYARFKPLVVDTVNPNVMGGALVLLVPAVVALPLFGWRRMGWLNRGLLVVTTLALLGMLVLTKSRGALIALLAACAVLLVLRWRRGYLLLLAGAVGVIVTVWSLGIGRVVALLASNQTLGDSGRLEIWSRAIYMIEDFRFTGIGMGSFGHVTDLMYPLFLNASGIPHAHNLFLQVAVDLGLPGLIAWLACLLLIVIALWQVYRRARMRGDGWLAGVGAGLLGSQTALVVHGLTDAVTWGMVRTAVLVWALWGLAMAAWLVMRQAEPNS